MFRNYPIIKCNIDKFIIISSRYVEQKIEFRDDSSIVLATFYGGLYPTRSTFSPPYAPSSGLTFYYQMIEIIVDISGQYTLTSSGSTVSLYGCFYDKYFDPTNAYNDLAAYMDGSKAGGQFTILQNLKSNNVYILVVTTSLAYETSSFAITASGPGIPSFQAMTTSRSTNKIEIYIYSK